MNISIFTKLVWDMYKFEICQTVEENWDADFETIYGELTEYLDMIVTHQTSGGATALARQILFFATYADLIELARQDLLNNPMKAVQE